MYKHSTRIKVRYGEVDAMGVVYYGNYAQYFEVSRVEAIRNLGISYKTIEQLGIILPVTKYTVKYIHPAEYDDELMIESTIPVFPKGHKIIFQHKVFLPEKYQEKPLTIAEVVLYVLNKESRNIACLPKKCLDALQPFFTKKT